MVIVDVVNNSYFFNEFSTGKFVRMFCNGISLNIITKLVGEEEEEEKHFFFEQFLVTFVKTQISKKINSDFRRFFNTGIKIERCMTSLCEFFSLIGISNNTG